jgi:hypothetical protein
VLSLPDGIIGLLAGIRDRVSTRAVTITGDARKLARLRPGGPHEDGVVVG